MGTIFEDDEHDCPRDEPNLVVLSDDDVEWRPEAGCVLTEFWAAAPEDLVLVSALLEPDWPWNKPEGTIEAGGHRALVRASTPAAAWCFPLANWTRIFPLREVIDDLGEDYEACLRIRDAGGRVAQLDLAVHLGAEFSLHGNRAGMDSPRPLDRSAWRL